MTTINFYMQAVWVIIIFIILSSWFYDPGILFLMLYVQLFLGFNQYLFSLIFLCISGLRSNLGILHFCFSTITIAGMIGGKDFLTENESLGLIIFFTVPWSLAIVYWIMSFNMYSNEKNNYSRRFRFLG